MARLLLKTNLAEPQPITLKLGINRLGRSPGNDIQIDNPTVSSTHCELHWLNDSVLVRDCNSTNGTFIDGAPVQEGSVQAGQTLRLGDVEFLVESTAATISVPSLPAPTPIRPNPMPDGTLPCHNHTNHRAGYRCTQCTRLFCAACIHQLRRVGGKTTLKLCPSCSGRVDPLPAEAKRKRRRFLDFLRKTLRIPFSQDANPRR